MRYATEWALFVLNLANTSAVLLVPCALVTATHADIIPGFLVTISAVILWLKLVSYAHCNYDLRCGRFQSAALHMAPHMSCPPAVWLLKVPDIPWEQMRGEEVRLQVQLMVGQYA